MSSVLSEKSKPCPVSHCYAPEVSCNLGHALNECPHFRAGETAQPKEAEPTSTELPLPWAGAAMGTDDLGFVAARSAPRLLGLVGSHNAGKTTLLVAWFLLLSRGVRMPERLFAGSCSIGGWENLAHWLRWLPGGGGPSFPPHTSLSDQRQPGLLHLTFRRNDGALEDVLLTDAPGEWFARWIVNRDDPSAEGARWTIQKSDALAIVIDCEALAGPDRGVARSQLFDLAQRLADECSDRPIIVVWTKSDVKIDVGLRAAVEERLKQRLPTAPHFSVTIKSAGTPSGDEALLAPFVSFLTTARTEPRTVRPIEPISDSDAFLSYRGK